MINRDSNANKYIAFFEFVFFLWTDANKHIVFLEFVSSVTATMFTIWYHSILFSDQKLAGWTRCKACHKPSARLADFLHKKDPTVGARDPIRPNTKQWQVINNVYFAIESSKQQLKTLDELEEKEMARHAKKIIYIYSRAQWNSIVARQKVLTYITSTFFLNQTSLIRRTLRWSIRWKTSQNIKTVIFKNKYHTTIQTMPQHKTCLQRPHAGQTRIETLCASIGQCNM